MASGQAEPVCPGPGRLRPRSQHLADQEPQPLRRVGTRPEVRPRLQHQAAAVGARQPRRPAARLPRPHPARPVADTGEPAEQRHLRAVERRIDGDALAVVALVVHLTPPVRLMVFLTSDAFRDRRRSEPRRPRACGTASGRDASPCGRSRHRHLARAAPDGRRSCTRLVTPIRSPRDEADVRRLGRRPGRPRCTTRTCTRGSRPPAYAASRSTSTTTRSRRRCGSRRSTSRSARSSASGPSATASPTARSPRCSQTVTARLAGWEVYERLPIPPPEAADGERMDTLANIAVLRRPEELTPRGVAAQLAGRPHAGGEGDAGDVRLRAERRRPRR